MSLTTVQLWQAMQEGKLASASECRQWAGEILSAAGNASLDDPHLLLAQLVKLGRLTPFQANALLSNDLETLTIGRHKLLAPLSSKALSDWYEAIDPSSNAARWLYALSVDRLKQPDFQRNPPSLNLARQHAQIRSEGLPSFSPPAFIDGYLLIAASPVEGRPLRDFLRDRPQQRFASSVAFQIVSKLADALIPLHQAGLVHGRIGIDQVWWNGDDEVTLLRDPFFYPTSPLGPPTPAAVGVVDDHDFRIRYAAPEFTAPGQHPTPTTDVYSLGCLWWELLTGQQPYADMMMDKVPTAAAKFPLAVPNDPDLSPGQKKCLSHMLAKNPASRFTDASHVAVAFRLLSSDDATSQKAPPNAAPLPSPSLKIGESNEAAAERFATPPPSEPKTGLPKSEPATAPEPVAAHLTATTQQIVTPKPAAPTTAATATTVPKPAAPVPKVVAPVAVEAAEATNKKAMPVEASADEPVPTEEAATTPPVKPSPRESSVPPIPAAAAKPTPLPSKPAPKKAKKKKKSGRPVWLLPSMLGGCLCLLGGLVWLLSPASTDKKPVPVAVNPPTIQPPSTPVTPTTSTDPVDASSATDKSVARSVDPMLDQFSIAPRDDGSPWLPPRAGQPYSLSMFPPGAQGFVFVRPGAWTQPGQGETVAENLKPEIETLWQPVAKAGGWKVDEVRELGLAMYGGRSDGWPQVTYRITLMQPISSESFQARVAGLTEQAVGDKQRIFVVGDQAMYLDPVGNAPGATFTTWSLGPVALMRELAEQEGQAGPLRRQMEQLWQTSDAGSDFTALLSTAPFFADARNILPGVSTKALSLCKTWLDERTQALLVSTSLEPKWFTELRVVGNTNDDALRFVNELKEKMKPMADAVEAELNSAPAAPYWRSLASRFPQMLRVLFRYQRFGIENGQAVTNFYLPSTAASNLIVASWMSLQSPEAGPITSASSVAAKPAGLKGEAVLEFPVDIGFDQEPLDIALATIAEEVGKALPAGSAKLKISIDGKAFELAGVTRNQQVRDFRFKQTPLRKLMNDIAARLNPDRTVTSITEAKQVVVWLVDATDSEVSIQFSTRPAAKAAGHPIPADFGS